MTRKLLLVAFIPAISVLALSACSRSEGSALGSTETAPASVEQSATIPASNVVPEPESAPAPQAPTLAYADVTRVEPVLANSKIRGTVISADAVTQQSTTPKEVCADVVVEERAPERDGNVGGTVAGAVVGGVVGNQVGGGDGRKLATLAGAIAGGFAGHAIDKHHVGGKVTTRTERQCHNESQTTSSVTGYEVTYRKPDGSTATKHMSSRPSIGSSIDLGSTKKTVGYDVTYNFEGKDSTVRMDSRPGDRLPVIDGQVVLDSKPVSQG